MAPKHIARGTALERRGLFVALILATLAAAGAPARADYVGSLVNRIFVDPVSIPVITDGYQNGDVVSYILETTPADTGSDVGHAAWMTLYVPAGVEVINAEYVLPATNGGYDRIPAEDTDVTYDGCGSRGCMGYSGTDARLDEGFVNRVQQDTGIFYSTDPRTAVILGSTLVVDPTGVAAQTVFNRWDFDQTRAYGEGGAFSGNGGQGNTPVVSYDGGTTWFGTGSIVAGPLSYYTNDYDPACSAGTLFADDVACTGPWQRIAYENAKYGHDPAVPVAPAVADPGPILLTAAPTCTDPTDVSTCAGRQFDAATPSLPTGTNAIRFVHGGRRLGELENARVTLRITDAVAFTDSFTPGSGTNDTFCLDSTGGDTSDVAAKDNPFRYYEPQHECGDAFLAATANLFKQTRFVNNVPSNGASLSPGDIVAYEIVFTNTSAGDLTLIDLSDIAESADMTPTANLTLIEPGNPLCAWSSYDGDLPGPAYNAGSAAGGQATWAQFGPLASGQQVSVFLCAEVDAGAGLNERLENTAEVSYNFSPSPADRVTLRSTTGGTVSTSISGTVYSDQDSSGDLTPGDGTIGGVTVSLYLDNNGNGSLDGGDTFVDSVATLTDGSYIFAGIDPGDYLVVETDLPGWGSTGDKDNPGTCGSGNGCNTIGTITVAAAEASTLNDFFDWPPNPADVNTITGTVYADTDQDATRDPGERGQGGIVVRLYRDNNGNGLVDIGDTLIQTQPTLRGGGYSFVVAEIGDFVLEVDTATLPFGSSLTTDNVETASFAGFGSVDADNDFGYFGGLGTAGGYCFAVADSVDQLVAWDYTLGSPPAFLDIGPTGTTTIEAIALQPGTNVLFAANAARLGTLDTGTGAFTPIGPVFGTCTLPASQGGGTVTVNDVDGLTFDPYTGILWGSEREGAADDVLLQIDPVTGTVVPDAFGPGASCVRVPTSAAPGGRVDLDDIAIDPTYFGLAVPRGEMYAISNSGGVLDRLIRIDKGTGAVTDVGPLGVGDMEGLGFDNLGVLYGLTGGSSDVADDTLWTIPKAPPPTPSPEATAPSYTDYEAVDCTTRGANVIEGTVFFDVDSDGVFEPFDAEIGQGGVTVRLYIDENDDGVVDGGDALIQTTVTDSQGNYDFFVGAEGNYVVETDFPATYPASSTLTTDNVEEADFAGFQNVDFGNDFGFIGPSALVVTKTSDAGGDVSPGDLITYTVTVRNSTVTRQTGLRVFDPLPAGTSYETETTVATGPVSGGAASTTLTAIADTFIDQDKPNDNNGNDAELKIKDDGNKDRRALVRWDLTGIPAGAIVNSATMRFFVTRERATATVSVHRVTQQWAEGTGNNSFDADWVHWDEGAVAPPGDEWATPGGDFLAAASGTFVPAVKDVYVSVDVQALVQAWLDGTPNEGVILLSNIAGEVKLGSRSNGGKEPLLDISYEVLSVETKDNEPGGLIADLVQGNPTDLVAPADGFILDTGDSLTVSFQVRVDDPVPPGLTRILNEVTVSSNQTLPRRAKVADPLSRGGAIGDRVWLDVDGDGVQDVGEPGLANVEVTLFDVGPDGMPGGGDDVQVGSAQLTGADGGYLFARLAPGTYWVDVTDATVPAGLAQSPGNVDPPTDPVAIAPTYTITAEELFLTADFGYTSPPGTAVVGDYVWNDIDRDGVQDPGEVGLAGVTLDLLSAGPDGLLGTADDTVEATQTTGADGSYLFGAVLPGEYLVRVSDTGGVLSGFSPTVGPQSIGGGTSQPILLLAGDVVDDVDFGYSPGACLPRIDFETDAAGNPLVAGQAIDNEWAAWGMTVGFSANDPNAGPAMIFDSANPTGGDVDLGSPNETCVPPGPGEGTEGELGQPGENCFPQGNLLIISEDGDSGDPDDSAAGGSILFTFASGTGVNALSFLDAENNQDSVEVVSGTYRDEFGAVSYANSDGIFDWSGTPWTETNDDGAPGGGSIFVNAGGELQLEGTGGNPERIVERPIDLSGASSAVWSFDWRCVGDMEPSGAAQDTVHVEISADGGGSWITLQSKVGEIDMCLEPGDNDAGSDSFDLAALFDGDPSDSRLRFRYTISATDEDFFVDNLEVRARVFFSNLTAPGNNAFERLPVGVSGARQVVVTFPASGSIASLDFCLGSLRDKVWLDANGDGLFQLSEAGIPGVTVTLVSDPDGVPGSGDEVVVATTTTDAAGDFGFDGLDDGSYRILITDTGGRLAGLGGTTSPALAADLGVAISGGDDVVGIHFGYNPPGTIGDTVFSDADGDGLQGPGEPGIAGVTVELYEDTDGNGVFDSTVDQLVGSTVTDAAGRYLFEGLVTGTYFASVDDLQAPLAGYAPTTTDEEPGANAAGTQIEVVLAFNGDSRLDADFGYQNTSLPDLSGNVFEDLDADGFDDGAGEPGFAGVTLDLLDAGGNVVATTTTDANGDYSFADLVAGDYTVRVTDVAGILDGYRLTSGLDAIDVTVAAVDITGIDFGYVRGPATASIGDTVWLDTDPDGPGPATPDGVRGPAEAGLPGVTLELWEDTNGNGVLDLASDTLVATTVTDADGEYVFAGLPADNYFVNLDGATLPAGLTETVGTTDPTGVIALAAGEDYDDADFGYVPAAGTALLGDRIWYDTDGDGLQDLGEVGIGGIDVTVSGPSGTFVVTTGPDGSWLVTGLAAGDYVVFVDTADVGALGYNTTPTNADTTYNISVIAGDAFTHLDWGFDGGTTGSTGDLVWLDEDGDGARDAGEPGIPGVTVNLVRDSDGDGVLDPGEPILATTTTAGDGSYLFSGLPLDDGGGDGDADYLVVVTDIDGVLIGLNQTTGVDGKADPYPVALSAGTPSDLTADFAYAPSGGTGVLGDFVWHDLDGDGLQDMGEPGFEGVTIALWLDDGDGVFEPFSGQDNLVRKTVTDVNGAYELKGLEAGTYFVEVTDVAGVLAGLTQTADPDEAGVCATCDGRGTATLGAGGTDYTQDFGFQTPPAASFSIAGTVFDDADRDAFFDDPGEAVVEGAQVFLYRDLDGDGLLEPGEPLIGTTTTDVSGDYSFGNLPPGDYIVAVDVSGTSVDGFVQSTQATTGGVEPVEIIAADVVDRDFGFWNGGITTTPVTLAWFKASGSGGFVELEWLTATEVGNLGFNLYVVEGETLRRLNEELILSHVVDSLEPQRYRYEAYGVEGNRFLIEDVDIVGDLRYHGPFRLNEAAGSEKLEREAIDWAGIRAASERRRAAQRAERLAGGFGVGGQRAAAARLEVERDGIYRVAYEALVAAGVDLAGTPRAHLALVSQGEPVPIRVGGRGVFGPGSWVEFVGRGLDTLYTRTNVYTLKVDRSAARRVKPEMGAGGPGGTPPAFYFETKTVESDRLYHFAAPGEDPWYDARLLATTGPVEASFALDLEGLVADAGPIELEVSLWGVTDFPQSPDHHVVLEVNEVELADELFDGLTERLVSVEVPSWLVGQPDDVLTVKLPHDTGALYDLVNYDHYRVTYPRHFVAQGGRLTFTAAAETFRVDGLPSAAVVVYRVESDGTVRDVARVEVSGVPGAYSATFAGSEEESATYYVSTVESVWTAGVEPARPEADLLSGNAELLVISHAGFLSGIEPLVAARRAEGYSVKVVDVEDVYARYSHGVFDPEAIRYYVAAAWKELTTDFVLLVGGDSYDYHDNLGLGAVSFVPSLYARTDAIVHYAPVDPLYADVDGDLVPDLAIGRLPVRTAAELDGVVRKTLEYGSLPHVRMAVLAADAFDVGSGYSFTQASEEMRSLLPDEWQVESVYLDEMELAEARAALIGGINEGVALTSYFGHSGPTVWSFQGLFASADAEALENAGWPTVVTQWGCWNTYYVTPAFNTLGHKLLLDGDRGGAAVLGAATLTDASSERLLGRRLFEQIGGQRQPLGWALLNAKRDLAATEPERLDVLLGWTLLGDPTLVVEP